MSRPSGVLRIGPKRTSLLREVLEELVVPVLLAGVLVTALVELLVRVGR